MSFSSVTQSRRTLLVASVAAALGVGLLVSVPGSGEAATSSAATASSFSTARSSSALTRGLAAQARTAVPVSVATPTASVAAVISYSTSWRKLPVLEPGARGSAVKVLQRKLGVKRTGWYGPMTLAKVKAFQKSHGLRAKGYVGPLTWKALFSKKKATPAPRSAPPSRSTRPPVTAGRVCPAPGFSAWGQGWGADRGDHSHLGMDMMGRRGTPILAIEDGYIVREGRQGNGALRIVMQGRSGSKFYYGHMSKDLVRAGQRVTRGQVIGLMGDSGSPGAVHLHFEYWKSGGESAAVDPKPLLKSLC